MEMPQLLYNLVYSIDEYVDLGFVSLEQASIKVLLLDLQVLQSNKWSVKTFIAVL